MPEYKFQPNRKIYVDILKNMTAEQRVLKSFELSDMVKSLFFESVRRKHSDLGEKSLHHEFMEYLKKCHNKNY